MGAGSWPTLRFSRHPGVLALAPALGRLFGTDIPILEELTSPTHIITNDNFLPDADARDLRGVFDKRFADPRVIHPERFLWDYWHVPDQYTLVRTQVRAAGYVPGAPRKPGPVRQPSLGCS